MCGFLADYEVWDKTQAVLLSVKLFHDVLKSYLRGLGGKFMIMQKLLHRKTNNWKIVQTNFNIKDKPAEQTAYSIFELQDLLDAWLKKDDEKPGNPKWER